MTSPKRFQRVAVLMGGFSTEREISLLSGRAVARGLAEAGYDVVEMDLRGRDFQVGEDVEAVFIALHGEFGEDGQVQEMLSQRGVPYTGSGPESSRAAMDKRVSKKIFVDHGIPTPEYEVLREGQGRTLDLPVVVKPALQGSSIGVHRVKDGAAWEEALRDTLSYDEEAVVERFIAGRELTVGIVDGEAMPVVEIVAPSGWYGYDAKYTSGASRYIVPAEIDPGDYAECQAIGLKTFQVLGCEGFGRVDMRYSANQEIYVLELNTIPGFTETSLLPKAAAEAGMTFSELCDRIMATASA